MIQKIKIRFITVAMAALFVLLAVIVTGMNMINYNSIVRDADIKLEMLSQNKGRFPEFSPDKRWPIPPGMTPETPYELRYFSVLLTETGELLPAILDGAIWAVKTGSIGIVLLNFLFSKLRDELGKHRYNRGG